MNPGSGENPRPDGHSQVEELEPHEDLHPEEDDARSWSGNFDPLSDAEERRVLFSAFDSFRWVIWSRHEDV